VIVFVVSVHFSTDTMAMCSLGMHRWKYDYDDLCGTEHYYRECAICNKRQYLRSIRKG